MAPSSSSLAKPICALLTAAILYGCENSPRESAFTMPTDVQSAEFGGISYDRRSESALSAYPAAESRAKRWDEDAVLFAVPMTRLMEANLGLPGHIPGWFFMFKVQGSPLEYYVKVDDGKVSGATEAQPIILEDLPYTYLPIDLEGLVLDSDDAIEAWLVRGGDEYLSTHPQEQLDFRLVHLDGQDHAVWSFFSFESGTEAPIHLFSVDAVTGESVEDPFEAFR